MKILVQDRKSALYFRERGSLTPEPQDAFDFECPEQALRFVLASRLTGAQMVVRSSDGEHIAVPLPAVMTPKAGLSLC